MPPRTLRIVTIAATAAIGIIACGGGSQPRSAGGAQNVAPAAGAGNAGILPKRERIDFLTPVPIGEPMAAGEHPLIANVTVADLDQDGLPDVLVCDVVRNRVSWIRQFPKRTFTEIPIGVDIAAPAHAQAFDFDKDGDLDVLVASMGVLTPSNAKIGSVIILENDGHQHFTKHVVVDKVAR